MQPQALREQFCSGLNKVKQFRSDCASLMSNSQCHRHNIQRALNTENLSLFFYITRTKSKKRHNFNTIAKSCSPLLQRLIMWTYRTTRKQLAKSNA